jgi:hypothetical protein
MILTTETQRTLRGLIDGQSGDATAGYTLKKLCDLRASVVI